MEAEELKSPKDEGEKKMRQYRGRGAMEDEAQELKSPEDEGEKKMRQYRGSGAMEDEAQELKSPEDEGEKVRWHRGRGMRRSQWRRKTRGGGGDEVA